MVPLYLSAPWTMLSRKEYEMRYLNSKWMKKNKMRTCVLRTPQSQVRILPVTKEFSLLLKVQTTSWGHLPYHSTVNGDSFPRDEGGQGVRLNHLNPVPRLRKSSAITFTSPPRMLSLEERGNFTLYLPSLQRIYQKLKSFTPSTSRNSTCPLSKKILKE